MRLSTRQRGDYGEDLAVEFLKIQGWRILCRQYRFDRGEIDIVAEESGELVFVEVKARRSDAFGSPEEAVTPRKQEQMRKVAEGYISEFGMDDRMCRFDIIAIDLSRVPPEITHLVNAF